MAAVPSREDFFFPLLLLLFLIQATKPSSLLSKTCFSKAKQNKGSVLSGSVQSHTILSIQETAGISGGRAGAGSHHA